MAIPFIREFEAKYESEVRVSPLISRIVADNPGPFTFKGTGVYIVGKDEVAVIDPGPDDASHVDALKRALEGRRVTHILVTHTHADHSPAAKPLRNGRAPRPMPSVRMVPASWTTACAWKRAATCSSCPICA